MARLSKHAVTNAASTLLMECPACLVRTQPQSPNHRVPVRDGQHRMRLMPEQKQHRRVMVI